MNNSVSAALTGSESESVLVSFSQKLQNGSNSGSPSDYMHSRSISDYHNHSSFIAVIIIMTLFLVVTITTTGFILAFCRKKNTVFALQKCEQESEYELDDMDNTDIEICSEEYETPKTAVRSRTYPSFSSVKSNAYPSSPSRTPLVNKTSQLYGCNSDDTLIIGENIEHNGIIRKIHRSHTVGIIYSSSKNNHDSLCQNDKNCDTALIPDRLHSNPSISISMDDIHDNFDIREGTLQFLDLHTIAKDEDGKYINV
ncbi:hypothetical protein SNE40_008207 [Patella caerulea]|uniref:Uncharacterized protein n=1 Tax=Patella caerulea TaxID=87958 RepID=A0AAN8JYE0_PATCE